VSPKNCDQGRLATAAEPEVRGSRGRRRDGLARCGARVPRTCRRWAGGSTGLRSAQACARGPV